MVHRIQYTGARKMIEQELAAMYQDLQAYQLRENPNSAYIEKMEKQMSTVMAFFKAADGAILEAEKEREEAFQKGRQFAEKAASEANLNRFNPEHREGYRSHTISRARQAWPELF